jgi:hypothetical protein
MSWPTARGVSLASTVGPLILFLPGASRIRLAREQVHLLQTIDCRASSEAVQQPSASADGVHLPGPPIPPVHFNTVPTPRVRSHASCQLADLYCPHVSLLPTVDGISKGLAA